MIQQHLWQVSTSLDLPGYVWPCPSKNSLTCFLFSETLIDRFHRYIDDQELQETDWMKLHFVL